MLEIATADTDDTRVSSSQYKNKILFYIADEERPAKNKISLSLCLSHKFSDTITTTPLLYY